MAKVRIQEAEQFISCAHVETMICSKSAMGGGDGRGLVHLAAGGINLYQ